MGHFNKILTCISQETSLKYDLMGASTITAIKIMCQSMSHHSLITLISLKKKLV